MKNIAKITVLLALIVGAGLSLAAEPINGAFGIKLGDVLDTSGVVNKTVATGGAVKYEVKAVSPHKSFQTYEVEVTAGTKKIHTITATGRYPGKDAAMGVFNTVKAELEKMYGPAKTNRREGAAFFASEQKTVSLLVNETRAAVAFLVLTCKDDSLTPLAEKEAPAPTPAPVATPAPAVAATGEIEGAFGLKFGEVFNPTKALATAKTTSGEVMYKVKPPTPNAYFDTYLIMITPDTKRIFEIWAMGPVPSESEGKIRRDSLVKAIEAKYQTKKNLFDSEFARMMIQGDKTVTVKTSRQLSGAGYQLELRYKDGALAKEGRGEAVDRNIKNVDNKGL
ncbi:MAG TPA: hypothetical protein VGH19_00830 [Verrucomicrobiae bacterium]